MIAFRLEYLPSSLGERGSHPCTVASGEPVASSDYVRHDASIAKAKNIQFVYRS